MGIVSVAGVIVSHLWGASIKGVWVNQAQQEGLAVAALPLVEKFILALIATAGAMHQHVFQLDQAGQVAATLEVAPAERFAQLALREANRRARLAVALGARLYPVVQQLQQLARLRR